MELISKEDAVALIRAEMDKIRTHSFVDGTARINLRLAKNIIEDMPSIDLADYVPKDFHDKTCEAMAKAHQEEIADMVRVVRCKDCKYDHKCNHSVQRITSKPDYMSIIYVPIGWCERGEREGE